MAKKKHEYWLVDPDQLAHAEEMQEYAIGEIRDFAKTAKLNTDSMDSDFWDDRNYAWVRPYKVTDGVLSIPVQGTLLNKFPYQLMSWATGYEYIREAVVRGLADDNVREIAFQVDSPGGVVAGCFELVDDLYEMRGQKKITAYVEGGGYSAAYAISSVADEVVVSRMGGVGSVGVVTTHVDLSAMVEKQGIKVTYIFAGKHKVDGNPFEELSDSVRARIQKRIDRTYAIFTETVARNRNMPVEDVVSTEALTYTSEEAIEVKFADRVGHLASDQAARQGTDGDTKSDEYEASNGEQPMAETTTETHDAAAVATARSEGAAEGRTAERQRFAAVHASDSFAGRETLAAHLLANTDMDSDAIIATLEASPLATAAAVEDDSAKGDSQFDKAMENTGNPDMGSKGQGDDGELTEDQVIQNRLGNAMKATAPKRATKA